MAENGTILVVGGGISGTTAALEAAEVGREVVIVEKNPYLGGRVAQLNKYFPKLCPPTCGLEIQFQRIKKNPNVSFYTLTEVDSISGGPGNYEVTLKESPRFVNERCTACGKCAEACDMEIPNEFNFGMNNRKAAYVPHEMAMPMRYVVDKAVVGTPTQKKLEAACAYGALDFSMKARTFTLNVGAIVWATGWNPYEASKMENLGFGRVPNVITNMMMERLASPGGPTGGKLVRPSDGKEVQSVAFVQCAGSRDENHLAYCSYICCLASMKQITYLREKNPDSRATVFYIDLRSPGRYEDFYKKVKADENVTWLKGKVAKVEAGADGNVRVTAEDAVKGNLVTEEFEMVVLATGMEPSTAKSKVPGNAKYDDNRFILSGDVIPAGVAKKPVDVMGSGQVSTAAALKAVQMTAGGAE